MRGVTKVRNRDGVVDLDSPLPAVEERPAVDAVVVDRPVGDRFEVIEHAFVTVVDLVAHLADLQAEVDVFEPVQERGVEAPGPFEDLTTDQEAPARDHLHPPRLVHRGMVAGEADVDVSRLAVLVDRDPGVLDRPVRIEQLAADDPDLLGPRGIPREGVEPAVERDRVVVEEDQMLARRHGRPVIAGSRIAQVLGVGHNPDSPLELGQAGLSVVRRAVIHHHDLGLGRPGELRKQVLQALPGDGGEVVDRDDDGISGHWTDPRSERVGARFSDEFPR